MLKPILDAVASFSTLEPYDQPVNNIRGFLNKRAQHLLVLFTVMLCCIAPAHAQREANRMYPDEITVSELELYSRFLNLSESQQSAVRQMHQVYLGNFAALKTDVIDPHGWPSLSPATYNQWLKVIEPYWRETEDIRKKIRRTDEILLVEIESILDKTQLTAMRRVRDHRERRTLRVNKYLVITNRMFHDLTMFAFDLDLSEADAALLNPLLVEYERRLTILLKQLHDEALKMELEPVRLFIRRGLGDAVLGEIREQSKEAQRDAWLEHSKRGCKLASEIDKLNIATSHRIEQTISVEGSDRWLDAFMSHFYEYADIPRRYRRVILDTFEKSRAMSEEDSAVFREHLAILEASLFEYERQMIEAELAYKIRVLLSILNQDKSKREACMDVRRSVITGSRAKIDSFREQLNLALSPGVFDEWDAAYAVATRRTPSRPTHPGGEQIQGWPYASLFIERRDMQRIILMFTLNEVEQAVLEEAFEVYLQKRRSIEPDLPEEQMTKFNLRPPLPVDLISRMRQADETVFAALGRLREDDTDRRKVSWLRHARQRKLLGHGGRQSAAGSLDITLFILDSSLDDESIEGVADLIDAYDESSIPIYKRLRPVFLRHYEWVLEDKGEPGMYPHVRPLQDVQQEIARLHADTMRAVGARLETDASHAMLDTFNRYCYGPVFLDPGAVHNTLGRTAKIVDLSNEQRESLLDLQVAYFDDYDRFTEGMLVASSATLSWGYEDRKLTRRSPSGIKERKAYQRLRFQRAELNAATIVKLRAILTTQQVKAIGGLPDLK